MTHATAQAPARFSKLIDPVDRAVFMARHYEQCPLHIERRDEQYFTDLVAAQDIEGLFNTAIPKSMIRMNKEGREVHDDQLSEPENGSFVDHLSTDRALNLFGGGHTFIINSGNRLFPRLDRYCVEIEAELRFRVQANIYITPCNTQGFDTHYDDHDVFILQVMGSKNWRVFHSAVELPSRRQAFKAGTDFGLQAPQIEVTLLPGDTLYIPRGVLHDASTGGVTSAHITLGLHPMYRFDIVQELAFLAQDTPAFRKSVPLGLLSDREAALREFKALLKELVDTVDVEALVNRRYASFVDRRRLPAGPRFRDLARLNNLNLNTALRKRDGALYVIERDQRSVAVKFAGTSIPIQPFLEPALDMILGDEAFAVGDINAFMSDKARLDLAGAFLKAGFLEVVDWR